MGLILEVWQYLTNWGLDKISDKYFTDIFWYIFLIFHLIYFFVFCLKFTWSLFLMVQIK